MLGCCTSAVRWWRSCSTGVGSPTTPTPTTRHAHHTPRPPPIGVTPAGAGSPTSRCRCSHGRSLRIECYILHTTHHIPHTNYMHVTHTPTRDPCPPHTRDAHRPCYRPLRMNRMPRLRRLRLSSNPGLGDAGAAALACCIRPPCDHCGMCILYVP